MTIPFLTSRQYPWHIILGVYLVIPEATGPSPEKAMAFEYNYFVNQRANEEWLNDLQCSDERRSQALADLSAIILESFPYALRGVSPPNSPDIKTLADMVAQKTLIHVQEHLSDYEGKSAFTTWVLKLAVHQTLLDLRMRQWRVVAPEHGLPDIPHDMYNELAQDKPLHRIHQIMNEELTENQRLAIRSMVMFRMPKEEVARFLGMELCDYFRMIHDARLRMKRRMQADGWLPLGKTTPK